MSESTALRNFKSSLLLANALLDIEKLHYQNPPRRDEQAAVQALRGGAAILMVASFECYVREGIEEYLSELTVEPLKVAFSKLPDKMKTHSVFTTLEHAMKGKPYEPTKARVDRLSDIDRACRLVMRGCIDPEAFSITGGNPSPKTLKEIFVNMGINDIFTKIHSDFSRKWRRPIAATFIQDKLNEIVSRRHVVAHTASALDISRRDLNESLRFLKVLAEILDREIKLHIGAICI